MEWESLVANELERRVLILTETETMPRFLVFSVEWNKINSKRLYLKDFEIREFLKVTVFHAFIPGNNNPFSNTNSVQCSGSAQAQ